MSKLCQHESDDATHALKMNTLSQAYRFFNGNIKHDIYEACLLPTENDFEAPNSTRSNRFRRVETVPKGATASSWTNITFESPGGLAYPPGGAYFLSSPFNGFDPTKPLRNTKNKRQRTSSTATRRAPSTGDPSRSRERKPNAVQRRKQALDGHFRTYKIRMLPTAAQKKELDRCFKVARHAFNWANECVKEGFARPNHYELRRRYRANKIMDALPFSNTEASRVSSNIASRAIKQLVDAYESNYAIRAKKPDHKFNVQYRSRKKTPTETILIDKDCAGPDGLYSHKTSTLLRFEPAPESTARCGKSDCLIFMGNNLKNVGGIRVQDREHVIARLLSEGNRLREDAKIRWNKRLGTYHFIYTYVMERKADPDPEFQSKRIVALDPGCNPFQQWYSPTSGNYGQLLQGARPVLLSKCLKLDALESRIARRRNAPPHWKNTRQRQTTTRPRKQRLLRYRSNQRLERKLAKEQNKLRGFIEAAHYSAADFLLKDYDIIVVPVLQTRRLTAKTSRIFGNKMARAMYTWSHYLFRSRLKSAAARYAGRHVYETSEPGTSKTCTHCGFWKASLKLGDKRYDCPRCGVQVDRQLAGARNNFFAAFGMTVGMGWDGVDG